MGIQQGYGSGVIASTAQPPALVSPVAHQVSYGLIRGVAAPGSKRVVVRVDGHVRGREKLVRRAFVVDLDLPLGVHTIRVETFDRRGRAGVTTVSDVYGLPRVARPRLRGPRLDSALEVTVRRLARGYGSSSGIYVQSLTTGHGAAWNAQAQFPAASSLKLAIAVTALAELDGTPKRGSTADGLLRTMLVYSDNGSANRLETLFGGSTSGGSALVNAMMRSLGLEHTEMYGGYTLDSSTSRFRELASGGIPLTVVDQSWWGRGKRTTAYDLAQLTRSVWLASGGLGPLRKARPGFSPADARYLLRVLADVRDTGKLDRLFGPHSGVKVFHKAGWISSARHDNGLIVWRGGVFVAAVMTYRSGGVGTSSDVLAGRVAAAARARFAATP
jgi:beta-lactamase class A